MSDATSNGFMSHAWARVAVFIVGYLPVALVIFLPITVALLAAGVVTTDELEVMTEGDFGQNRVFFFVMALATAVFGIAYTVAYSLIVERKKPSAYGLTLSRGWFGNFWLWALVGAALLGIIFIIELVSGLVSVSAMSFGSAVLKSLLYYSALFVLVAIAEEVMFRGYVLQTPIEGPGVFVISAWVLISSIAFSSFHAINPGYSFLGFLNTFVIGIALCFLLFVTKSLWVPIGFHFGWNLSLAWLYSLNVSGLDMDGVLSTQTSSRYGFLTGGDYGPEGGLICTAVILVLTAVILPRALFRMRSQERILPWLTVRVGRTPLDDEN